MEEWAGQKLCSNLNEKSVFFNVFDDKFVKDIKIYMLNKVYILTKNYGHFLIRLGEGIGGAMFGVHDDSTMDGGSRPVAMSMPP